MEYAMVLLGLRTILNGSTYLGVFLANGKYYYHPLLPRPSAPHPFSGLSISSSTALISCTSSGPVPRVTHTHIHLHLPLYKVMSRLAPFFLFVLFLSGVLGPSILARHDGGRVLISSLHFCIHYSRFDLFAARVLA